MGFALVSHWRMAEPTMEPVVGISVRVTGTDVVFFGACVDGCVGGNDADADGGAGLEVEAGSCAGEGKTKN